MAWPQLGKAIEEVRQEGGTQLGGVLVRGLEGSPDKSAAAGHLGGGAPLQFGQQQSSGES
jgi:hypothetical protein